jgi:hypothetical protein
MDWAAKVLKRNDDPVMSHTEKRSFTERVVRNQHHARKSHILAIMIRTQRNAPRMYAIWVAFSPYFISMIRGLAE